MFQAHHTSFSRTTFITSVCVHVRVSVSLFVQSGSHFVCSPINESGPQRMFEVNILVTTLCKQQ